MGKCACLSILLVTMLALSCSKPERPPEGLLTEDQMVSALAEVYIAEQKISTLGIPRDSLRRVFGVMENKIFEKVNTPDSVFKQSLNYYVDRPQILERIYTALVDTLNLHEQRLVSSEDKK